jgi:hypothetical protein
MTWFLPLLERLALRRKRAGASGVWTAVALTAFLLRQYEKRIKNDMAVLREELKPGETLVITHTTQPQG